MRERLLRDLDELSDSTMSSRFSKDLLDKTVRMRGRAEQARTFLEKRGVESAASLQKNSARIGITFDFFSVAYLSRLGVCIFLLVITSVMNAFVSSVAGYRNPNVQYLDNEGNVLTNVTTLPDIGHDLVRMVCIKVLGEEFPKYHTHLPDTFVAVFTPLTLTFMMLHPKRFAILRRVCAVFALINLLRTICVSSTTLPDPAPYCQAQFGQDNGLYKSGPVWPHAFFRGLKLLGNPGLHHTCGDLIFSGHSVALVMCCCVFKTYCNGRQLLPPVRGSNITKFLRRFCLCVRTAMYVATFIGLVSIISTRLHYTLDVLIATYLSILLWDTYHYHMNNAFMRQQRRQDTFSSDDDEETDDWTVLKRCDLALRLLRWLEAEEVMKIEEKAMQKWAKSNERRHAVIRRLSTLMSSKDRDGEPEGNGNEKKTE